VNESPPVDPLLAPYLASSSDEEARQQLGELLAGSATPLLWRVFRRQLGRSDSGFDPAELEDLHANTLLKLQIHLAGVRAGEREAPQSFLDYVAIAGFNAVAGLLMARQPERTRLRDRVRYVLRREEELAVWPGVDRDPVCGRATDRGAAADAGGSAALVEPVRQALARHGAGWGEFSRLVREVLLGRRRPCRLEDLVDALAEVLGVHEVVEVGVEPALHGGERRSGGGELAVDAPTTLERMEVTESLRALWSEIDELPPNQRVALLLSLRDSGGHTLVDVLRSAGAVPGPTLAAALEVAPEGLDALLVELPWDDLRISARLGLTRQQVINLRKSARLRLARRLRGRLPGVG